jgi:methylthioribose-1-phosphate isomerase
MKVDGVQYRTIWPAKDGQRVDVIDQTKLPFRFETVTLASLDDAARAIKTMIVRGAPLIGATAAYGMALAMVGDASDAGVANAYRILLATRPTAVNLAWALDDMRARLLAVAAPRRRTLAYARAAEICDADVAVNRAIGTHGLDIVRARATSGRVNVLTHCNAGWLATVDWGTALAPVFMAHDAGLAVHVWVDETRPRNQGASLTAWELAKHGVPHTVIADNAGGHLMQHGRVDLVIVGTDRTTATGDVCNKVGTYLKALAAHANGVPFYVGAPSSSIDWRLSDGVAEIPIEERAAKELTHITGRAGDGSLTEVQLTPDGSPGLNVAFDVTPARYVTGLITERGVAPATREGLAALFPEHPR